MAVNRDDYKRHSRRVTRTKRWQVLRHEILERDGWACVDCGTRRGRLEIDHVKPVRSRPDLAFAADNLATRCSRCHSAKTRIEVGWSPVFESPDRDDWANAVAELATGNATPASAKEKMTCWNL